MNIIICWSNVNEWNHQQWGGQRLGIEHPVHRCMTMFIGLSGLIQMTIVNYIISIMDGETYRTLAQVSLFVIGKV